MRRTSKPGKKAKCLGPRRAAAFVLGRVYGQGAYADILLAEELEKVRPVDRGLATELVYGVLRRSITIDWIIERFSRVKIKKMERAVLTALRLGVYQLYFLSRIPARAAVDESVGLVQGARKRGFLNAVLRKVAVQKHKIAWPGEETEPDRRLSILYSHPQWMIRRWLKRYGEKEVEALLRANLASPRRTLRVNTERISRQDLLRRLRGLGVVARECRFSPLGIDIVSGSVPEGLCVEGLFVPQDEASQLVPLLVAPRPGSLVLDACAAPGAKTTAMAEIMKNRGSIIAVDRSAARLETLCTMAGKLGIRIIRPVVADSIEAPFMCGPALAPFDVVLLDAPCSGLGVLGRTPDIKLHRKESDIAGLARTQKRLLQSLLALLRPGASLVYSVCSLEPEETRDVIGWALERQGQVCIEKAGEYLPGSCAPLVTGEGFLQTLPQRHGMDGFFAVRLRKRKEG